MNGISYVRARAPLRISFGGGGTDIPPYCDDHGGVVLSATFNRYVHTVLKPLEGGVMRFRSLDLDLIAEYGIDTPLYPDGKVDLLTSVARRYDHSRSSGFELSVRTDVPPGSGVGASSAVVVSTICAFKEWLRQPQSPYEIASAAYEIERVDLAMKGGKQDQYAAAFGGFNFIEFNKDDTVVTPLKLDPTIVHELEERIVLCHTGSARVGMGVIDDQVKQYRAGNEDAIEATHELKRNCLKIKKALLLGDIDEMGELLNEGYLSKKRVSDKISTPASDKIYEVALGSGALGGKVSGAGGGGFMFFIAGHDKKLDVTKALQDMGFHPFEINFEPRGARSWKVDGAGRVQWDA